jgi:hypothetical protein
MVRLRPFGQDAPVERARKLLWSGLDIWGLGGFLRSAGQDSGSVGGMHGTRRLKHGASLALLFGVKLEIISDGSLARMDEIRIAVRLSLHYGPLASWKCHLARPRIAGYFLALLIY